MEYSAKKNLSRKLTVPFIVALIGVLAMIIGTFLPYITATGQIAQYIEQNPDRIENEELGLTAQDLKNIPLLSVSKVITAAYGEKDGELANVILWVFGGFLVLAALFTVLKKPVAIMIFDLLTCGTFSILCYLLKPVLICADKYAWSIGYYTIVTAIAVVFSGAVWMLVKKINIKKQLKLMSVCAGDETAAETPSE